MLHGEIEEDFWLRLRVPVLSALLLYCGFAILLYWPLLLGQRFFWEDFFIGEYPIRDYCYYMFGIKHTLPFWNPYNWNLPAVLADGQNGFWYPTNIFAIIVTRIVAPNQSHIPVLVPELLTIMHLPLAALGMFYLLRKHFRLAGMVALIAGLTYGFGARIVADQNHPMFVYQLSLLPWATFLLFRSWNSWHATIGLGLILGVGYLAGQPQVFLFTSFFFFFYTLAEVLVRKKSFAPSTYTFRPFLSLAVTGLIAIGIAAIQLLPTLELAAISARSHLSYSDAMGFALHPGGIIVFLVPKMFREAGDIASRFQPIQPIFYWSALAEIFALFAVVVLWKNRHDRAQPSTRHLVFVVSFCIFALCYAVGHFLPVQWLFWRFVPLFNQVRAPARMLWFFWLFGTIYGGIGLQLFLTYRSDITHYRTLLLISSATFVFVNIVACSGAIDVLIFPNHTARPGIQLLLLPSLLLSVGVAIYLLRSVQGAIPHRFLFPIAAGLILLDLYFVDFSEHRNTLSRDTITAEDAAKPTVQLFFQQHAHDQVKLIWQRDTSFGLRSNLGMILRLRIEDAIDSNRVREINPMRVARPFPPTTDKARRAEIMGVASLLKDRDTVLTLYPNALPFLKLYTDWRVVPDDSAASRIYTDSSFDFHRTILIAESPGFEPASLSGDDTAVLTSFSENVLQITTQSSKPAMLLVNDLFYPAWKAWVDGKPVKITRAFTSLRAVPVPAGIHRLEMKYESAAFEAGWKISAITLLLACAGLVILRPKKQKNPDA